MKKTLGMALVCGVALSGSSFASEAVDTSSLVDAFKQADFSLDMRYRYAFVTEDSLTLKGKASTLKTSLGARTKPISGFSLFGQFDDVSQLGKESYYDGFSNGTSDRPTIYDIDGTELNQAYLQYDGVDNLNVTIGRQAINLGNGRFIGSDSWNQQEQTFDSVGVEYDYSSVAFKYYYISYITSINTKRAPGGSTETDAHAVNLGFDMGKLGELTAYGYFLALTDVASTSSKTMGASWVGSVDLMDELSLDYRLEHARQSGYRDNSSAGRTKYSHGNLGLSLHGHSLSIGYEELGTDSAQTATFDTPYASLHEFNGWTDKFISTPTNGLEDRYIKYSYNADGLEGVLDKLNGSQICATYHKYDEAAASNLTFGTEWNVGVKLPISKEIYTQLTYSNYKSKDQGQANSTHFATFDLGMSL